MDKAEAQALVQQNEMAIREVAKEEQVQRTPKKAQKKQRAESPKQISRDIAENASPREYLRRYFADTPVLIKIAWCESRQRHYTENGRVLRGEITPSDVGIMQINEYYHRAAAERLGYDIKTLKGNLAYARHLYEEQGVQPWSASAHCWSTSPEVAQR